MQKLGLAGHFSISPELQATAKRLDIDITYNGNGLYSTSHSDVPLNRKQLKDFFLAFMHQPVKTAIERGHRESAHPNRVRIHQLLRFAGCGSVTIPADLEPEEMRETSDHHVKVEQLMHDEDLWAHSPEIGIDMKIQSSIPGSRYNKDTGFSFALDPQMQTGYELAAKNELRDALVQILYTSTGQFPDFSGHEITLTAQEFKSFCRESDLLLGAEGEDNLAILIEKAEFEEALSRHIESIQKRASTLAHSAAFQNLATQNNKLDSEENLKRIMRSTTALSPLASSKSMQDILTRHHFSERHSATIESISKEYAVFMAVMDHYAKRGHVEPAEMEALAQEFYPILSFSAGMADILQCGAAKAGKKKKPEAIGAFEKAMHDAYDSFQNASVLGVSLSRNFMRENHKNLLSALEKHVHLQGAASQAWQAGADATLDFTREVFHSLKEPKALALLATLATTLYVLNGNSTAEAKAAVDFGAYMIGDTGLMEVQIDPASVPKEALANQNWHWDIGVLGPYKHYLYDNAVTGSAKKIMDGFRQIIQWSYMQAGFPVNAESAFSSAAQNIIDPLSNKLFAINLIQNLSHAGFWVYVSSKSFRDGLKGGKRVIDLFAPLTDLTCRVGIAAAEKVGLKKRTTVADRLMELAREYCPAENMVPPEEAISALAKAAQTRADFAKTLPDSIMPADLKLVIGGLSKQFRIGAHNLAPTLRALQQFDVALENMAAQIGIDRPFYADFLKSRIDGASTALKQFQTGGDLKSLQSSLSENLRQIMSAQVRCLGCSPVYMALAGEKPDSKTTGRLQSIANESFGRLSREDAIANYREKSRDESSFAYARTKAAEFGTILWGGMVKGARAVQKTVRADTTKQALIVASGVSAVATAIDLSTGGNHFTSMAAAGAGKVMAGAVTGTAFLIYNFFEDVILVHGGSFVALTLSGAAAGYAYRKGIRPAAAAALESMREENASPSSRPAP